MKDVIFRDAGEDKRQLFTHAKLILNKHKPVIAGSESATVGKPCFRPFPLHLEVIKQLSF